MTLEASVELERIAAQVREDALLLDLVQSTPIGGLLDVLHREARGCGRGGNRTFFGSGIVPSTCGGVPTAVNSPAMKLAAVASTESGEKLSSGAAVKSIDRSSSQ